ncbi:methyltransferase domain-containing protein [Sinomicrobium sp. M5D2P9]
MNKKDITTAFRSVDTASDIDFILQFLDTVNQNPTVKEGKRLVEEQMQIRPGDQILDVGCGTGDDTRRMAELTGKAGKVTGVDISENMVAMARTRHGGTGLPVEYVTASADKMPFKDASFNSCRMERVLIHVENPGKVIDEIIRVTKPGGRVTILDMETDAIAIYHPDRELNRKVLRYISDNIRNGWIGSHLGFMLKSRQLEDIKVIPHLFTTDYKFLKLFFSPLLATSIEKGALKQQEVDRWWSALEEADKQGFFLPTFQVFIASGRKA